MTRHDRRRNNSDRRRSDIKGPVLIWGINPVLEFLENSPDAIEDIYTLPSFGKKKRQKTLLHQAAGRNARCRTVMDFSRMEMPESAVHQGVAAKVRPVWLVELDQLHTLWKEDTPLVVVCDQITDPGNMGAIIRSSAAFGAHAVILSRRNSAEINGTVIKASAGAILHTRVCVAGNTIKTLQRLQKEGLITVALTADRSQTLWSHDLSVPIALVLGAEGRGLRQMVVQKCDTRLHIPQSSSVESLNVASACAVALYETRRQRSGAS